MLVHVLTLALGATLAAAQWPILCPNQRGGPYSAWNETRCPATMSCAPSGFNPSSVGCCPFPSSVPCGGYTCCPQGTVCVHTGGGGYSETFNCTQGGVFQQTAASTCKGGPPLPMSTTKKNVLWIGDSLSLGMIPFVAANLSDVALVQHAPWGGDGGAEETAYGLRCLETFLASPSGMQITPDLVLFNWGMHDGPMSNATVPGQNAPPDNYGTELTALTAKLVAFASTIGAKLAFAHTTPYICTAQQDGCVQNLNHVADAIMADASIPVLHTYEAVIKECGPAPQTECFALKGCWCPHCNAAGYSWLASTIVAPALRELLSQ